MEEKEIVAWGRIYATLDAALIAATGRGLTQAERQQLEIRPQYEFGAVMRRALASRAVDARTHALIAVLSRDITARDVDGSVELATEERGTLQIAMMTMDPESWLVTSADAARMLGVSRARVTQLCDAGKLDQAGDAATWVTRESVEARMAQKDGAQ